MVFLYIIIDIGAYMDFVKYVEYVGYADLIEVVFDDNFQVEIDDEVGNLAVVATDYSIVAELIIDNYDDINIQIVDYFEHYVDNYHYNLSNYSDYSFSVIVVAVVDLYVDLKLDYLINY